MIRKERKDERTVRRTQNRERGEGYAKTTRKGRNAGSTVLICWRYLPENASHNRLS